MKNTQKKTGEAPARTPEETKRRDQSQSNVKRDESQGRSPQREKDPKKLPQEPKRFEEQPIKPVHQPQARGEQTRSTQEKNTPAGKAQGRNVNPTDEKYLRDKDQYIPGREDKGSSEGPTKSDKRR